MKKFLYLIAASLIISCTVETNEDNKAEANFDLIKSNFTSPPGSSGVNCWWWWLNGNVDKAAISKDLEAMKARNFQGAMIFDAGGHNQRGNADIPQGPLFGSEKWNELFVFALDEAQKLGLEIGFNIQSGWNLGGPRVTPEYTAKQITFSETKVSGNKKITLKLALPHTRKDFYKDIAVLAVPLVRANKTTDHITNLDLKLGYHELGGSAPDARFLLDNNTPDRRKSDKKSSYILKKTDVLDLTSKMSKDGYIDWDAPSGEWSILRFGYTCTGSHVSTSSGNWKGSVLDYMSKEAFDFYWNDVVEPILDAAGEHVGATLKYMETDSWECGGMNWTDNFPIEFQNYRGYELKNFLPIVAGYIVDDMNTSNAFLNDFRKTIGDLVAHNHYAEFQKCAHKYNMGIQPESAGPHAGPMDGIKNYGFSDIVMSEFWSPSAHRPKPNNRFFLKQASSAAHIYGKKIVGAESFTTIGPHWNDELWHDQKSAFDHEICAGLNRMYFHTFTCSPPKMGVPGQEYFAGTHVNPQVTWWNYSGPFIDYMHRIQSVVQEGKFVADVLYYYGDHVPNVFPYKHADPAGVFPGFDYDVTDETIFLQLKVEDGKIIVPGGIEYRVLVLPDHRVLSLAVLKKVEELLQKGATIIGFKPECSGSLAGGEEAQKTFGDLANNIWGKQVAEEGKKAYGKGKIVWGMTARDYLLSESVNVDFDVLNNDSKTDFDYIHYKIADKDIYFVSNQTALRQTVKCRFRINGIMPEIWNPLNGEIKEANSFTQKDGQTALPLTFEPYGAILIVFDSTIMEDMQGVANHNCRNFETVAKIEGKWTVHFDPKWGGPGTVSFPELIDWTQHPLEGVKYYSGTAVYNKSFEIDFELFDNKEYFIQLGSVKDVGIAKVKVNGIDKGVLWTPPFRVNISNELRKGQNSLEVEVVNSWFNRVRADQTFPDKKQYTSTNIRLKYDFKDRPTSKIPLEPSGLLGPVTIEETDK